MYKKIVEQFDLKAGDIIWLSSDITRTAFFIRSALKEKFDPVRIIGQFQEAVGEDGTIMLPTFNYDFSNNGVYDYVNSKGITGALGNIAIEQCGFVRTRHPLHSFAFGARIKSCWQIWITAILLARIHPLATVMKRMSHRSCWEQTGAP